jgi:S-adenosylmethionine:tRNA ribosyltransferase-isomerase
VRTDAFDFDLPPELIAAHPARPRDSARLLDIGEDLVDRRIVDLPTLLDAGDVLVLNDTKVMPARLLGTRGAAKVEVTLHKRHGEGVWHAFARPAKRLKQGDRLVYSEVFAATVVEHLPEGEVVLDFGCRDDELIAALHRHGLVPLPPYIKRTEPDPADRTDYQTVFAAKDGAVAAPTAGLHFTPALLRSIEAKGVEIVRVTLHVGAGTFLPVKADDTRDHRMHAEYGEISSAAAAAIDRRRASGRIVAVGSTSLRLLESAASHDGTVRSFAGETTLFVVPGYRFKVVDRLLTNFHLPRSTLFMLVSAFAGLERMKAAYAHAIAAGYRFYSYGDACFLRRAA